MIGLIPVNNQAIARRANIRRGDFPAWERLPSCIECYHLIVISLRRISRGRVVVGRR